MAKVIIRWFGIALSILCALAIVLGFIFNPQVIHNEYFHQSGIRWLAEGTVAGLILAAIGYWEND